MRSNPALAARHPPNGGLGRCTRTLFQRMAAAVVLGLVAMKAGLALLLAAMALYALLPSAGHAAAIEAGQALAPLVATDQHDRPWRTEPSTRLILLAADMTASTLVTDTLRPHGADVLASRQAVFIADIHAMPSLVSKMFAMPALRELPFAVGLGREAALTAHLPRQKNLVTLITLHEGRVESVQHLGVASDLRRALAIAER